MAGAVAFDLDPLVASVREDGARPGADPDRGAPLWSQLSTMSWRLIAGYVRYLASQRPAVYGLFAEEDELAIAVADVVEQAGPVQRLTEADFESGLAALCDRPWLIATPLVNIMPPPKPVELSPECMLVATWAPSTDGHASTPLRGASAAAAMRRMFDGHAVTVGARIATDLHGAPFDTRHSASLVRVERGSRDAARERARAVARYCVAVWTLLSPPVNDTHTPLWPAATEWLPGAQLHSQSQTLHMRSEGTGAPERQEGMSLHYEPDEEALYFLPDDWRLTAPLQAVDAAAGSRAAASLLSSAWSLYLAGRTPSDLQWLDRLVYVMQAREALCEPPDRERASVEDRWLAATQRCGVLAGLRRLGFNAEDLRAVRGRARQLRNLGVHSADASLLALGYPADRSRLVNGAELRGVELAPAYVREGTAPAFHATRLLAAELWERAINDGFDDERHEQRFG